MTYHLRRGGEKDLFRTKDKKDINNTVYFPYEYLLYQTTTQQ